MGERLNLMRFRPLVITLGVLSGAALLLHTIGLRSIMVSEYSPRRAAYLASPSLMWTNIVSDVVITSSYAILFAGLLLLIRRLKHLPQLRSQLWVFVAFMIFIACSGVINLLRIISVWWPMYQFSIVLKIVCAVAIFPATTFFLLRTSYLVGSICRFFEVLHLTQEQGDRLRKSEEFLERTNRLAGMGGWELDLLTEEVTWSDETCRIHGAPSGYKPTLAKGLSMYAPSARETIVAAVQVAASGGPGWDLELPVLRFDGRQIWARTVGAAEIKEGQAVRLSGAFQDITAKVEAREALRQARERVALATESGEIGIWDWDVANGVLTCDALMYRLHGKDPLQAGTSDGLWRDHLHPDDKARVERALHEALVGTKDYDTEFRIIWEDGSVHTLRGAARVTRDEDGNAVNMVGANWDVTEARLLLSQLADQHERLRVTLHSIGDGVITTDSRGAVAWLNPIAEKLTGWTTYDAMGRPLMDVFRTLIPDQQAGAPTVHGDGIRPAHGATLIARDGTEYGIESSMAPIANTLGGLFGSVLVFRDVTERRRLAAQAEEATKLQLRLKDEFLSHVSHELRSPLTSIYSFASIIADDLAGETTPQQKEYLGIVLKNVTQLQSMIEDLLTVTQSKEGKLTVKQESTSPAEAIVDALQTVRSAAANKAIELSFAEGATRIRAYADPVRLRQVLIILLDNAIKFTPYAGQVSVDVSTREDGFLTIQVRDTGCGIAPEKWSLVFENLYQVTDATHADTSQAGRTGLGLGLHIARNLVQRQGGCIWVRSEPEEGSVFSFTVPTYSAQDLVVERPLGKLPNRRREDVAGDLRLQEA